MSTEILAPADIPSEALATRVTMTRPPELVLAEAQEAAKALQRVLASKPDKVEMNGQQYLEFEDWQTLGRFYGITPKEEGDPEFVEFPGGVQGFKASAVALHNGEVISRATAYCLTDEEKWRSRPKFAWMYATVSGGWSAEDPGKDEIVWEPNPKKPGKQRPKKERRLVGEETVPLFQLASMAQTRANAKVYRNVLSWVVVLAGYKPTPAEELDVERVPNAGREPGADVEDAEVIETSVGPVRPGSGERAAQAGVEPDPDFHRPAARPAARRSDAPQAGPACPKCGKPTSPSRYPGKGKEFYCYDDKLQVAAR